MELTVIGNGMQPIYLKDGAGQIQTLYQELSRIDIRMPAKRLFETLKQEKEKIQSGVVYVVISMNQDPETVKAVAAMAENGCPVLWVIPVQVSTENTPENIRGVNIFKWEMNG